MNKLSKSLRHKTVRRSRRRLRSQNNNQVKETIFPGGMAHFTALIHDINHAQSTIDLETYIFQRDHLGKRVAEALIQAAQRGVTVRILVDGAGSPMWSASFAKKLEKAGAKTRVFHPFPWQLWNWSRSVIKAPILMKWLYLFLKINYRNHRKACIIDNNIAYIGSVNISKCHLNESEGGKNWRDLSIRLSNISFDNLTNAFDYAWTHKTFKERVREAFTHIRNEPIIRLNHTRHRRRILYRNLLRKVSNSVARIWITNAYFVPDNFLLKRLKDAASRGVDVRILLPKTSDVMMMPWASSTFYYSLLNAGVRIFEYLPSVLHAKSVIIDNWAVIGSSNLNHRSLLHDLEVDVKVSTPSAKETLERWFEDNIQHAKEISLKDWYKDRPLRQRIMGQLVLYMKYWI